MRELPGGPLCIWGVAAPSPPHPPSSPPFHLPSQPHMGFTAMPSLGPHIPLPWGSPAALWDQPQLPPKQEGRGLLVNHVLFVH